MTQKIPAVAPASDGIRNPFAVIAGVMAMCVVAACMVTAAATSAHAYPRPGQTERVSAASDGSEADGRSIEPTISGDGRYVAFWSTASNLVTGDTNGRTDVFVHDRHTGAIDRVSVGSDGTEGNGSSTGSSINADGRFVAFESAASNLTTPSADSNGTIVDVFVHDRESGTTERISVASNGSDGNGSSRRPSLSSDGRYVVFYSDASNLVTGDTNGALDVFVHDRETNTTERVSVSSDGTEGNGHSVEATISADGRYIAFQSVASNLAPPDTSPSLDVFLHDRTAGVTSLVSRSDDDVPASGASRSASISPDGRHVVFSSLASELVPHDTNGTEDVFVLDRETGKMERVSVAPDGVQGEGDSFLPSISPDARFVAFYSVASNLGPADGKECPFHGCLDVYVYDRDTGATERVSVSSDGARADQYVFPCPSCPPAITDHGQVAFQSLATNLVASDFNGREDVFVRDRGPSVGVGNLSVEPAGAQISVSGRAGFSGALLSSSADPSSDGATGAESAGAELTQARVVYRPEAEDVLVNLSLSSLPPLAAGPTCVSVQCTGRVSPGAGAPGIVYGLAFSFEGTRYEVRAFRSPDAASPDSQRFAIYRCAEMCTEQARVTGAIGTTGPEVIVSVPLSVLGTEEGSALTELIAYTAAGEGTQPLPAFLDEVALADASIQPREIALGIAPAGTPQAAVTFDTEGALSEGTFSGTIDASALPAGDYDVWATACLGETCGAASKTLALDVGAPGATKLVFTKETETSEQYSDLARFEIRLSDPSGDPLQGAPVTFTIAGEGSSREISGLTDHDGIATVTATLEEKPGAYQLIVRYEGDGLNPASTSTADLIVTKEDSVTELAVQGLGETMTLRSRVADFDSPSAGIAGRTMDFFSDAEMIGTAESDAEGVATIAVPTGHRGGGRAYRTVFRGDDFYRASRSELPGQAGTRGGRNRVIPGPMSGNGRITAWVSDDADIVPGDTNGEQDVFARDLLTGETMLVSVADDGSPANEGSSDPAPSGDGRYVAFRSAASNLIPGDTARVGGLFVHDLVTGRNERVSVSSTGDQANKAVFDPVMSHDGRFVVFESTATNLDPRDTNLYPDIYVHDRETRTTKVVSVDSERNVVQDGGALFPDISPDGRYVAFQSFAALVPDDTNGTQDVYVHDTVTGETEIASVSTEGLLADRDSRTATISAGGRYVAFSSYATTLVPQDTNGAADIFVRDRQTDTTRRISVTSSGTEAQSGGTPFTPGSYFPSISANGRYVAYQTDAPNLMQNDTRDWDVFVHDLVTGSTTLGVRGLDEAVPDMGAGTPELGSDGRHVTFLSGSTNLVPEETDWFAMYVRDRGPTAGVGAVTAEVVGDSISAQGWATFAGDLLASAEDPVADAAAPASVLGSELTGFSVAVRPELEDLFVRWELAHLPAIRGAAAGIPGVVHGAAFEVDGVRYELRVARLGARAPFFGLFRCDPTCMEVQELQGGYGESGREITTSVDIASLGLDQPGAVMKDVIAFSGPGEAAVGALHHLDEMTLADVSVPEVEIRTGIAAAGADPRDVVFDGMASITDGRFAAELSVEHLAPGDYDVWTRGCLGERCGAAVASVTIVDDTEGTLTGEQLCTAANPIVDKLVDGNIVVPSGETCKLVGSTIDGNVTAREGASLDAQDNSIEGNVAGDNAESFRVVDNDIVGNVEVKHGDGADADDVVIVGNSLSNGSIKVDKRSGDIAVASNDLTNGNVEIKDGAAGVVADDNELANGSLKVEKMSGDISVASNHIAKGRIHVADNFIDRDRALVVVDNVISDGDLKVEKNRGLGDKSVADNVGGKHLVCKDNEEPFVGGPNGTWTKIEGQCQG